MPTYRNMGPTHIAANVTTVECHKQVRTWRLLRAIMELLIPTCNCTFVQEQQPNNNHQIKKTNSNHHNLKPTHSRTSSASSSSSSSSSFSSFSSSSSSSSFLTGTIFGYKKGKVKFCVQTNSNAATPILLLELAVPTTILAREMRGGVLRIALECSSMPSTNDPFSLLEMPVWKMYCNGRRVGFAVRRRPSKADTEILRKMKDVVAGAGVVSGKEVGCEEDDIMYLRGNFERIRGSNDAESFHLIDPDGHINQDLSIFFLRSR
ncbi:protein MIZU-KUSSEI 1-like [Chenopodium quinoa]|uniref:protein MIZU-KUSSEI 1-like n=1 Tax=Chenopodium quinoa TaxID=63459 RepID=UPI000B7701CD|nr:protein MIZU-KUSSEI 1-like [Chenopodium quinoa]